MDVAVSVAAIAVIISVPGGGYKVKHGIRLV